MAPDNLREYSGFIAELVQQCVRRYGMVKAASFWWRIATEPNTGRGGTGQDIPAPAAKKVETYVNYYVAVNAGELVCARHSLRVSVRACARACLFVRVVET